MVSASLICFGVLGFIYAFAKGGYTFFATIDADHGTLSALKVAGFVTLPLSFIFLALAVFIPGVIGFYARLQRFIRLVRLTQDQHLGSFLPEQSWRQLWRQSADPVATHVAIVEANDQHFLSSN